jgi:putative transcriptional regulator
MGTIINVQVPYSNKKGGNKMRYKLKQERLKAKLTQEELSKRVGIARPSYTNIELGYKDPSFKVAVRIKQVLNYQDDDIFLEKIVHERNKKAV